MWENLQHEFYRFFVDNGASSWWINGIKTTILVTLLALVIGVILGGIVGMIRSIHEQTGKLKILNGRGVSDHHPGNSLHDPDPDLLLHCICQRALK